MLANCLKVGLGDRKDAPVVAPALGKNPLRNLRPGLKPHQVGRDFRQIRLQLAAIKADELRLPLIELVQQAGHAGAVQHGERVGAVHEDLRFHRLFQTFHLSLDGPHGPVSRLRSMIAEWRPRLRRRLKNRSRGTDRRLTETVRYRLRRLRRRHRGHFTGRRFIRFGGILRSLRRSTGAGPRRSTAVDKNHRALDEYASGVDVDEITTYLERQVGPRLDYQVHASFQVDFLACVHSVLHPYFLLQVRTGIEGHRASDLLVLVAFDLKVCVSADLLQLVLLNDQVRRVDDGLKSAILYPLVEILFRMDEDLLAAFLVLKPELVE